MLILETSEELLPARHVGRIVRSLGERGILGAVDAVLLARPPVSDLSQRPPAQDRARLRAEQRDAVVEVVGRSTTRQDRIEAGIATVEHAAATALAQAHAARWVTAAVTVSTVKTYKQARRGRPRSETRYREITTNRFSLATDIELDHVAYDAVSDGCFPLITNDANLSDAEVLAAYRYQPTSNGATIYSTASKTPHPCC